MGANRMSFFLQFIRKYWKDMDDDIDHNANMYRIRYPGHLRHMKEASLYKARNHSSNT